METCFDVNRIAKVIASLSKLYTANAMEKSYMFPFTNAKGKFLLIKLRSHALKYLWFSQLTIIIANFS